MVGALRSTRSRVNSGDSRLRRISVPDRGREKDRIMPIPPRKVISNYQMEVCSDVTESDDYVAMWLEVRSPEMDPMLGEILDIRYYQGVPCVLLCPKEPGVWMTLDMLEEILRLARQSLDDIKP